MATITLRVASLDEVAEQRAAAEALMAEGDELIIEVIPPSRAAAFQDRKQAVGGKRRS